MNKVKINIYSTSTYSTKVEINLDENKIVFNGQEKIFDSSKMFSIYNRIINITQNWQNLYSSSCITDGINFQIEVHLNGKETIYKGLNSVPDNFYKINNIIKSLKEDMLCC